MTDLKEVVAREIYPEPDPNCLCCEGGARLPKRLHETQNKANGGAPIYVCAECQGGKAILSPKAGNDVVERAAKIIERGTEPGLHPKEAATQIAIMLNDADLLRQPEAAPGWQPISEAKKDGRYVFFALKDIYSDKDKGGPKFKFGLSYFDQEKSEFMNTGWSSHWTPILVMNTPDGCVIRKAYALIQPNGGERE